MAVALVQNSSGTLSGAGSFTMSLPSATTLGNLLVCTVANFGGGGPTISGATGWLQAILAVGSGNSSTVYYKPNCPASDSMPTFTATGATFFAMGAEFSGLATSSPVDKTSAATPSTSPATATNASVDAASGELAVWCGSWALSKSGTATTADTFNNGTANELGATGAGDNDTASSVDHFRVGYSITTGNASAASIQQSNNSMNLSQGALALVTFLLPPTLPIPNLLLPPYCPT